MSDILHDSGLLGSISVVKSLTLSQITLSHPLFSPSLRYAAQKDLAVMRKVYDFCALHGVYPEISQFNRWDREGGAGLRRIYLWSAGGIDPLCVSPP